MKKLFSQHKKILALFSLVAALIVTFFATGNSAPHFVSVVSHHSAHAGMFIGGGMAAYERNVLQIIKDSINTEKQRHDYAVANKTSYTAGAFPWWVDPNVAIAPGYLRSENVLTNTTSTYQYFIRQGDKAFNVNESFVNVNDLFVPTYWTLGFGVTPVTASVSTEQLVTYPSNTSLITVGGAGALNDFEVFYNGQFSVLVGQTKYIPQMDARRFYYAPQTQRTAATNRDQFLSEEALLPVNPIIVFSGQAQNELKLNITIPAAGIAVVGGGGATISTVLYVRGFTIFNGARQ